jgi:hypothetical protein
MSVIALLFFAYLELDAVTRDPFELYTLMKLRRDLRAKSGLRCIVFGLA